MKLLLGYWIGFVFLTQLGWCTNITAKVDRWYWYSREIDVKSLSEQEKQDAIAEMRRRAATSGQTAREHYRWILIRYFGDEEMLAGVVKDIQQGERRTYVECVRLLEQVQNSPQQIPILAELLYLPEEARLRDFATEYSWGSVTASLKASWKIRDILQASAEFSPEMKKWADGLSRSDREALRQTLRRWWEENREAFMRKEYAAVKPPKGERVSELPAANPPVATSAVSVALPVVSVVTQTVATVPAEMSSGVDGTLVLVVGVLVLLGAAIVLLWRNFAEK